MKPGAVGYDLGIRVPVWWWEKNKGSSASPEREWKDDYYVELTLATVPCDEFVLYWKPVDLTDEYFLKTLSKTGARRDEQRKRLGWTARDHCIPELGIRGSEHIEHKYFDVLHQAI